MKISLKMERDTMILKLDEERSFAMQKADIQNYLAGMKNFLQNGDVKLSYEGVNLTFEEEVELCNIADEIFGKEVYFCHKMRAPHEILRHIMTSDERIAKKVIRDIKSGETVETNGDLIVVGDVEPTAQIMAQGDIYVIGNLRGVAHAGCGGNRYSIVYAMGMNPVMVKIADMIGFNEGGTADKPNGMAMIEGDGIIIKLIGQGK